MLLLRAIVLFDQILEYKMIKIVYSSKGQLRNKAQLYYIHQVNRSLTPIYININDSELMDV